MDEEVLSITSLVLSPSGINSNISTQTVSREFHIVYKVGLFVVYV